MHTPTCLRGVCRPLALIALVAPLALAALPAAAADYTFAGTTDSGPLFPVALSGSFSFTDPVAGFDGDVALSQFSLSFTGQSYSLLTADALSTPFAAFAGGTLLGIGYADHGSADPAARPFVEFVPGFTQFHDEAFFSYTGTGGVAGNASYLVTAVSAVPEPEGYALMAAGLGALGALRRRQRVNASR